MLGEKAFANSGEGLDQLVGWVTQGAEGAPVAVAIEVPHGSVVETLMAGGVQVFAINPKQLDRFRDRFSVAGAKDDRRDARVLASSLRTDRQAFRRLERESPELVELREWSRMSDELVKEKLRLCSYLREQLSRFFPQVLELARDLSEPWILELLEVIPTPEAAHRRRVPTIKRILRAHRIRRLTAKEVQRKLREQPMQVAPGTVAAATAHIRLVRERLQVVHRQIRECNARLDALCDALSDPAGGEEEGWSGEHRDATILRSMPGVGRIVLSTLLAEAPQPLRSRDYHRLRALAGVAPITRRSGRKRRPTVVMRRACNPRLRQALFYWARAAAQHDPAWKARYQAMRACGQSCGRAYRGLADRLLNVAMAMLRDRTLYQTPALAALAA